MRCALFVIQKNELKIIMMIMENKLQFVNRFVISRISLFDMINIREINFWNTKKILYYLCFVSFRECQKFRQLVYLVYFMINFVNSIENEISFWRIFLIVIFFFRGGNYRIVIFEFGISVHEKLRHFIIVMEKYTKNDGNQNFNGFNKVHEKLISRNFSKNNVREK